MTLRAGVEFGGDNLSEQLNRRYDLLPAGIYHGFKIRKVPGQAQIQIHKDGTPLSVALANRGVYQLTCSEEEEPLLEVPSQAEEQTLAVVLDADYQWGQRRRSTYQLVAPGAKQAHHLELARITVPAGSADSTNYIIEETYRDRAKSFAHVGMPLGAMLPIASHLSGAYDLPESGEVSAEGWMRCDGAEIPPDHRLRGIVPNLTDGRFLRGATTAGETGGSNAFTLTQANLPAHHHSIDHGHDGTIQNAGNHNHSVGASGSQSDQYWQPDHRPGFKGGGDWFGHYRHRNLGNHNHSISYAGSHTHILTITGYSGQSGKTGEGNPLTHLPKYFDAIYLIKVH